MAIADNWKDAEIVNGHLENLFYEGSFDTRLHTGDNPQIHLRVDFSGISIEKLTALAFDAMKVKFRPHVKSMTPDDYREAFNNQEISWRDMLTKAGSSAVAELGQKSVSEIDAEIVRMQTMRDKMGKI